MGELQPKIHYLNDRFMAIVDGVSEEPIGVTPMVYDDLGNCGVGIRYDNGTGNVWGLMSPRDLVASWRATEVLKLLDHIEHGTLCSVYYTGMRNPHESDMEPHVNPMIEKIGRAEYDRIMSMPVPEKIIRAIIDNQGHESGDELPSPSTYPLTNEVRAGTIEWRQEFADAGVEDPIEVDAEQQTQKDIIAPYEDLLQEITDFRELPRECFGMSDTTSALLQVDAEGIADKHDRRIAMAVAAVGGEIMSADSVRFLMPSIGPRSSEELYRQMEQAKREAVVKYAKWWGKDSQRKRWWQLRRKQTVQRYTISEMEALLLQLVNQVFRPKDSKMAEQASEEFEQSRR